MMSISTSDTTPAHVVGTEFYFYTISGYDLDIELAHASRYHAQHRVVLPIQLYSKHGVGQYFGHNTMHANRFFFSQW